METYYKITMGKRNYYDKELSWLLPELQNFMENMADNITIDFNIFQITKLKLTKEQLEQLQS